MMNFIRKYALKFGGTFAALAMVVTMVNANSCCAWITHQEEMPESASQSRILCKRKIVQ